MKKKLVNKDYFINGRNLTMNKNDFAINTAFSEHYKYLRNMGLMKRIRALDYFDPKCYNGVYPFKKR